MIQYLNNASKEISYVRASDGVVVTKNPFDPEYDSIVERFSLQLEYERENRIARNNYERDVKNAQESIDAGRTPKILDPSPLMKVAPEDYTEETFETDEWAPPLLTLKTRVVFPSGSGPALADVSGVHPLAHVDLATARLIADLLNALSGRKLQ